MDSILKFFIDEADFIENCTGEDINIKTRSDVIIGSQSVSNNLPALKTRSGDLGKLNPGASTKADANKVYRKKMNSRSSGLLEVDAYFKGYDVYYNLGTKKS